MARKRYLIVDSIGRIKPVPLVYLSRQCFRPIKIFELIGRNESDEKFIGVINEKTIKPINKVLVEKSMIYAEKENNNFKKRLEEFNDRMMKRDAAFASYCSLAESLISMSADADKEYARQGRDIIKYLKSGEWLFHLEGEDDASDN